MIDFLNSDREKRTKSIRISMLFVLFLFGSVCYEGKNVDLLTIKIYKDITL